MSTRDAKQENAQEQWRARNEKRERHPFCLCSTLLQSLSLSLCLPAPTLGAGLSRAPSAAGETGEGLCSRERCISGSRCGLEGRKEKKDRHTESDEKKKKYRRQCALNFFLSLLRFIFFLRVSVVVVVVRRFDDISTSTPTSTFRRAAAMPLDPLSRRLLRRAVLLVHPDLHSNPQAAAVNAESLVVREN